MEMRRLGIKSESGLSIVEILVASFILFFVIAAVMGLLSMSYIMSATARSVSEATAFANKTIEQVRAMPYASIGIQGGDPNGTLPPTETTIVGGVTYTVNRSVTWVDDVADNSPQTPAGADSDRHDYKNVKVTLSWKHPNGKEAQVSVETNIREPWVDTKAPTVEFTDNNVAANSIAYEDKVYHQGSSPTYLYVQGDANDNLDGDGKIASLVFYVDGRVLRNLAQSPTYASWAPNTQQFTNTPPYPWDTLGTDESGTALYPDGTRELKVEAWDNSGSRDFRIINVLVDNYAPETPTNLSAAVSSANGSCFDTVNLTWTGAMDGTDWTYQYDLNRYKNGSADGTSSVAGSLESYGDSPRTPFSIYTYTIQGRSPMGRTSTLSAATAPVVTRPKLTGTRTGSGNNNTDNLTWTGPTFETSSGTYYVHRATSWTSGNITSASIATVTHPTVTWSSGSMFKPPNYYYQIEAQYVMEGTTYTIWSNVIGPSSATYPIPP